MQAFGVLDRYIGKTIFITIMITIFILVSLSSIIKFVDQFKKIGQGSYSALDAGIYTLLSVPKDIQIFFPMASLLGVLLGLGMLAQYSELLVMQVSGYTRIQIALSVMKTAIPLVLLSIAIDEWVAPECERKARNYRIQAIYNGSFLYTKKGLWLKDNQNFIHIRYFKSNDELGEVSIYAFNKKRCFQSICHAKVAKFDFENKLWRLSKVHESNLKDLKNITNSYITSSIWNTNLTPDKLGIARLDPNTLSISDLYNYTTYLESNFQDARRYQLNMWKKIFQPILVIVMMLMAVSFIFGPLYNLSIGRRILIGINIDFIFYVLDQVLSSLTLVYSISPIIGASSLSILFFLISLWLLLKYS